MTANSIQKIIGLTAFSLLLIGIGSSNAFADTSATIVLNNSNIGTPGNYGQVQLVQSGSTITVTVSVRSGSGYLFFGNGCGACMFGFNSNAAITTIDTFKVNGSSSTEISANIDKKTGKLAGGQMDGFGDFDYQIKGPPAGQSNISSFSFVVHGTFTNVTDLVVGNGNGIEFAAHIWTPACTGFIGGLGAGGTTGIPTINCGETTSTPEPTSITALGAALLGLAFAKRKLSK